MDFHCFWTIRGYNCGNGTNFTGVSHKMRRFISAVALCIALLAVYSAIFLRASQAKEDVIASLLKLPAPPPPNPSLALIRSDSVPAEPPADDAPIGDLIAFWSVTRDNMAAYKTEISDRAFARLADEVGKDPSLLTRLLDGLPPDRRTEDLARNIYLQEGNNGRLDSSERSSMRAWLTQNSDMFIDRLEKAASSAGDDGDYFAGQASVVALARKNFSRAGPIIDKLLEKGDRSPSYAVAKWALYKHSLDEGSVSTADTYRSDLKAIVEDKTLTAAVRDLAMDALVDGGDFQGLDEWYVSLLKDESLLTLGRFTGLTSLILAAPPGKYDDSMITLLGSDNLAVRSAAARNLAISAKAGKEKAIIALIPWLGNPKWATDVDDSRSAVAGALKSVKSAEAVPGLVAMLKEPESRERLAEREKAMVQFSNQMAMSNGLVLEDYYGAGRANSAMGGVGQMANVMTQANNAMANAANQMVNAMSAANRAVATYSDQRLPVSQQCRRGFGISGGPEGGSRFAIHSFR